MRHDAILPAILEELSRNARAVSPEALENFTDLAAASKRVFVAGAGRSGFVARAFANRLMHLGLTAYFVGETTTPAIGAGDLLVIGSGSGETGSLVTMARRAKAAGAKLATLTIHPEASIGGMADAIVAVPGATPKSDLPDAAASIQPMGSAFEQLCLLVYDAAVMILMDKLGRTSEEMFRLHANLE